MEGNGRGLRIGVSLVALAAAVGHMLFPARFIPDAITAWMLVAAALPWLSSIVKSIDVPGLGKLELLEQRHAQLRKEVDALRFLVSGFVNDYEMTHLRSLFHSSFSTFHFSHGSYRRSRPPRQ